MNQKLKFQLFKIFLGDEKIKNILKEFYDFDNAVEKQKYFEIYSTFVIDRTNKLVFEVGCKLRVYIFENENSKFEPQMLKGDGLKCSSEMIKVYDSDMHKLGWWDKKVPISIYHLSQIIKSMKKEQEQETLNKANSFDPDKVVRTKETKSNNEIIF